MLLGAGKMGGALLEGWLAEGLDPGRVAVVDPAPPPEAAALIGARGIALNPDLSALPAPAVILLAVKPQVAAAALPAVAGCAAPGTLVVSIMAGKTLANLEAAFPAGTAIVRSIPNTPAAVGRGITVAVPNGRLTPAQRELAHALLAATGACEWIDDEALMDAATAVSGSGPAYVFLLVESLARAGAAAGLPADLAARLARATVIGSGELLRLSDLPADQLRRNVTSPGGTTAAALAVLMAEAGFDPLLEQAVAAATARGRELAG
ncbi:pyrroline-5-carboxylate reductase [Blastochloris tepida]|uniref:Pyrroline-5-carboxylate reductase n=1 Tax=Blastochloris tepida TaxID=2233851 RepID=A0A348FWL8_9HYPH|nr:pyrroline-5-carboxylate reductase [Blastochloris tepida]